MHISNKEPYQVLIKSNASSKMCSKFIIDDTSQFDNSTLKSLAKMNMSYMLGTSVNLFTDATPIIICIPTGWVIPTNITTRFIYAIYR